MAFFKFSISFMIHFRFIRFDNHVSDGVGRPYRQGALFASLRIQAIAIRGLDLIILHHPIPAALVIRTFVVEAGVLKIAAPGGFRRRHPFQEMGAAVGAGRFIFQFHFQDRLEVRP